MSNTRTLSFMHNGDYISYSGKIYKVDWSLEDNNNVINVRTNHPYFIEAHKKVKWLRNYNNITLVK